MAETEVPLAACGLAPSVLAALFRAGFRYQKDLAGISARELASEAQISVKDAVGVLAIARSDEKSVSVGETALDLLQVEARGDDKQAHCYEAAGCKLLVVDTIAFHFRHGFEDYTQRARALGDLATFLHGLATDFDLAVVLINHITTKSSSNERQVSQERPALGENWAHSIANRVAFEWETNCRVARLIKSASLAHISALFEVSERGMRDVSEDEY
ncbi:DNA repair protein rad51c [Phytophthora pseudosyringae]|uniref:DNA repair protein rad51c n=1 Tax=Phytophthora pseudosyringae TaxID=221518 RepID=A0A8T1W3J6_9STRA|nr:DNA repair protein rad51c [Phytophthora pseudosyringae]